MTKTAEGWNRKYPVGTKVRFYPIPGNKERFIDTETKGTAWTLSSGKAIVGLRNVQGSKPLEQIEVVAANAVRDDPYGCATPAQAPSPYPPSPYPASSPWSDI